MYSPFRKRVQGFRPSAATIPLPPTLAGMWNMSGKQTETMSIPFWNGTPFGMEFLFKKY